MFKTEIEFSKNTLYVNVRGILNHQNIAEMRRKLYYIINEYGIEDIVIDLKNIVSMDKDAFYRFLDDYDIHYGGNLMVVEP